MTNYEFIKSLHGTRLGAVLSVLNLCENTRDEIITRLSIGLSCHRCKLNEKEESICNGSTPGCHDELRRWLDSPVDDIIVLSKLPKEFNHSVEIDYAEGWNDCVDWIKVQMVSSEKENIE